MLSPNLLLISLIAYFGVLFAIAQLSGRKSTNQDFFTGSHLSPWYVVAFGMIGASLSGVTFVSIPGWVLNSKWSYIQMVLGYGLGYAVIMYVLLPLYYKKNLISIYQYLQQRLGESSHKTAAVFFMLSRIIGASFRLYLMTMVLQDFIFVHFGIPFWLTVFISLALIWSYTYKGGIKTIIWTDTLQTLFMLLAVIIALYELSTALGFSFSETVRQINASEYSKSFFFAQGWSDKANFFKQFIAGALIAIVMTGLDQDMMQKNLSCKNLKDSQKNIRWFYLVLVVVNILFLSLGVLLYHYAEKHGINLPQSSDGKIITDKVFPFLVFNHLPVYLAITFLIGLLAAAYSSADSALTALTTSFCVDILANENPNRKQRIRIHLAFSLILFIVIICFYYFMTTSAIYSLFKIASYTYGPLLGMFAFALFTNRSAKDKFTPYLAIISPVLTYFIDSNSEKLFAGYKFSFELLAINGLIMFLGIFLFSKQESALKRPINGR